MHDSLKDRIIAMKRENPRLWPAQIAKALGCRRDYVAKALASIAEDDEPSYRRPIISNPKATGSGRQQVAGYLRLM